MKMSDLLLVSIRNLWRRKLRTSLTILGVIIGTVSIVLMVSLGIAMNQNFIDQVSSMGSLNTITVYKSWGNENGAATESPIIDDGAIKDFEALEGATAVSPILELQLKAVSGKYVSWLSVRGIRPEMSGALGMRLDQGRFWEEGDKLAFVFGGGMKYNFYNPAQMGGGWYGGEGESPVDFMNDSIKASYDMNYGEKSQPGQTTKKVKPFKIAVIGVMAEGQGEHDYYAYTTFEQAQKIKKEKDKYDKSVGGGVTGGGKVANEGYSSALVYVKDMDQVATVQQAIKDMGFEANSLMEYLESMQQTSNMIQMVLGGIGAVSLLVAAIGITNTMIMSIYERTKEIGVMKVIGASLGDIKKMFLAEAAMIGFIGGGFGLLISFLGSKILNYVGQNITIFGGMGGSKLSIIPIWLYGLAIGFTTLVGIISGYFPAVKAMRLSVLQALRTE